MRPSTQEHESAALDIKVVPRAGKTEVDGEYGDGIRIRIKAPPVDGKANTELVRFIAGCLGKPVAAVRILRGVTGRMKSVMVEGVPAAMIKSRLLQNYNRKSS